MKKKIRTKKKQRKDNKHIDDIEYIYLYCEDCGREIKVDNTTKSVLCGICTLKEQIKTFGMPIHKPVRTLRRYNKGKPVGWHWMREFVDKDGTVYHKGNEMPELKGKRPITIVKKKQKKKLTKNKKKELFDIEAAKVREIDKKMKKILKAGKKRGLKGLEKEKIKIKKKMKRYI